MLKGGDMEKGYIHIYTGNGKGKTTAAFGLAIRAALSGKKVFIGQFVKDMKYNETKIENYLSNIKIKQLGRGCFIYEDPEDIDKETAKNGLEECGVILSGGEYDLVILDEINIALYYKLFEVSDVVDVLNNKAVDTEVVLTGRYAPKELIDMADLVTEMVEIKHYYSQGVLSRSGIDC
jgi:cob(I)alamin adenosyltransferase